MAAVSDGPPAASARTADLAFILVAVVLVAAAIRLIAVHPGVSDVAWLITVAERVLDGERLYVDVIEANPPLAVYLSMGLVQVGRTVGVAPDALVGPAMMMLALASAIASGLLVRRLEPGLPPAAWVSAWIGAAFVLPQGMLGQREQIALLLLMPAIVATALRDGGEALPWTTVAAIGLAAGLGVAIKPPHFALALVLPALAAALARRSVRPLLAPELVIAAAVTAAYGLWVVTAFPAYVRDLLPLLADVYLPLRAPLAGLVRVDYALAVPLLALAAVLIDRDRAGRPLGRTLLLAAAGFYGAYLIQGKGWSYHVLPAYALALTTATVAAAGWWTVGRPGPLVRPVAGLALVAAVLVWTAPTFFVPLDRGARFEAALRLIPGARVVNASSDATLTLPVLRRVGDRFGNSVINPFVSFGVDLIREIAPPDPITAARLDAHEAADIARFAADTATPPEVILAYRTPRDWLAWAARDPATAALLDRYETVGGVDLHDGAARAEMLVRTDRLDDGLRAALAEALR